MVALHMDAFRTRFEYPLDAQRRAANFARFVDFLRSCVHELSQEEIGELLVVFTTTVRTHAKDIYGKLDVHSRDEARHCAKDLDLM